MANNEALFERRLRPIYDSLEAGNNKKALQEVEKLLKKNPSLTCGHALKALALLRLGRDDESNHILKTITLDKSSNDTTMQVLSFCYKEMEQLDKICNLYSHAAKQYPGNEEILAHLFISYVRLDDYKSQQSTALQLYKAIPKPPYYYWAVMSSVLQGIRGPESSSPDKRKLFLTLAQKMMDKMINENKIDGEQEVQLYLTILDYQKKYAEALEFLDGDVCQKFYPGAPISIKINLLINLEKWTELNNLLKTLLIEDHDRWDYYLDYLTSVFKITNLNPKDENGFSVIENCHEFLCQLIESDGRKVRGPYLARLELHTRMRQNKLNAVELLGNFNDLVTEYYHLFGDKSCCTHDITLFLNSLDENERLNLSTNLLKQSSISATMLPVNKEQMLKHICALQISRICGDHERIPKENLLALYTALRLHYENGYLNFGKNLLPTDMGPSDPYSLLGTNIMYDISLMEQSSSYLIDALILLQYVLKNSRSNFHVKLICLKIFHFFGCTLGAHRMYESLDIKHIQLDSMGYLHCALLSHTGQIQIVKYVYDQTLKFFTNSYKDRLENIAMSYKFGSFSKLEEFMDFRDRLTNSLHYATISAEELLLELVCLSGTIQNNLNTFKLMSIKPADDRIRWNDLSDNRDLNAIVRWDPIYLRNNDEETKESFDHDIEALQCRSLLLRLVASMVDLMFTQQCSGLSEGPKTETSLINGQSNTKLSGTLEILKDSFNDLFERIKMMKYKKLSNKYIVNLLPSRLHLILELPYQEFFTHLSNCILDLFNGSLNNESIGKLNVNVLRIQNIITDTIKLYNDSDDMLRVNRDTIQKIVGCVEIFSLYTFILSVCHEKYFQSSQTNQVKKQKRKDSSNTNVNESKNLSNAVRLNDKQRLQIVLDLMRNLKQTLQNINNDITQWKIPELRKGLTECMNGMSLNPTEETVLMNDISEIFKENHTQCVKDLRNILKDKIRMINK